MGTRYHFSVRCDYEGCAKIYNKSDELPWQPGQLMANPTIPFGWTRIDTHIYCTLHDVLLVDRKTGEVKSVRNGWNP